MKLRPRLATSWRAWRTPLYFAVGLAILAWLYRGAFERIPSCRDCNVILITIDALRADHLQAYGYPRLTSPHMMRFAGESWIFDQAITPRPKTTPSLVSLLSGRDPLHSGVRQLRSPTGASVPLLQQILKQHGRTTAAFVSNWVLQPKMSGLERGFDHYDYDFTRPELNRRHIWERNADETNAAVLSWLAHEDHEPFFLWIHYMDPHGPYTAPVDRLDRRFRHVERTLVSTKRLPRYQLLPDVFVQEDQSDVRDYVDRYDEEVQYVDKAVGDLLEHLRGRGLFARSLVIISADHGESHFEHNYFFEHGAELYEDGIRVPLMIRFPEATRRIEGRTAALVSVSDLFPTILEFLRIRPGAPIDGVSVLPLAKGARKVRDAVVSEDFDVRSKAYRRIAIRTSEHKLVRRFRAGQWVDECYDLASDPQELDPEGCDRGMRERLRKTVDAVLLSTSGGKDGGATEAAGVELDERDSRILKSLGYLN